MKPPPARSNPATLWRPVAIGALIALVLVVAWTVGANRRPPPPPPAPPAPVEVARLPRDLAPYAALGSYLAENNRISDLGWTPAQFDAFAAGVRASYEGRGLPLDDGAKRLRDDISRRVQEMIARENPDPMEDYFRTLREKEGVKRTASGLHYRLTEPGTGPTPGPGDTVTMSFSATLPDGTRLPALSRARVRMAVKDLLPGLSEGVQLLRVGGKGLVYVPPSLAYREADWPEGVPRNTPLVFFLELHEIIPPTQ
ncbi:MAG TPA: FKBP-type peptidyl-prolyl cis-trans isomerase [Lacunisphaera sp.]|jgi:FKBP-type peptidyl-prolyl cis-trans isomerase|nr:FKBP-type peptidyl-prolyl cis-trans isomerase [Lacunisphaera sp.]